VVKRLPVKQKTAGSNPVSHPSIFIHMTKNKIILNKYLIAGGNSTLLVWDCPLSLRKLLISKYLGKVEQIGFIKKNRLEMMGQELCINATIAFASELENKGFLYTSGLTNKVIFSNTKNTTNIELEMSIKRDNNIILFPGIGYLVTFSKTKINKSFLSNMADKYRLPAFGLSYFRKGKIETYVFVKDTNSFIKESACGSASIATSIVTGQNRIIQSTDQIITVKINNEKIKVSAKVTKTKDNCVINL
jgi:histidine racemase